MGEEELELVQIEFLQVFPLHQVHKHPEGSLGSLHVVQDDGGYQVHPLHILQILVILRIGLQNLFQLLKIRLDLE